MEVHHHGHVHETKKWKEYLFQFFMLFLAVFCGFLAEYQLEHMIEKDRERQFISSLVYDLKDDQATLEKQIDSQKRLIDKLDSLFGQGLVPQTIVVGIPNMSAGNRTLQLVPPFMLTDPANPDSPMGTADRFLEFMETELVPFIASNFGASDTRLFAGNSRGGLLVMYSLIQKPELFAGRFCFSTPLWRENNLLVERVSAFLAQRTTMKSFLYLSAGEDETGNMKSGLDAMGAALRDHPPSGFVWHIERTPGVDHQRNAAVSGWSALTKWGAYVRM